MVDIEPRALVMLQEYPWPGNVRELENVIQRAIILAPGNILRAEDLPAQPARGAGGQRGRIAFPAARLNASFATTKSSWQKMPCANTTATRPWPPAASPSPAATCTASFAWRKTAQFSNPQAWKKPKCAGAVASAISRKPRQPSVSASALSRTPLSVGKPATDN